MISVLSTDISSAVHSSWMLSDQFTSEQPISGTKNLGMEDKTGDVIPSPA
jgi:hypothetical protein